MDQLRLCKVKVNVQRSTNLALYINPAPSSIFYGYFLDKVEARQFLLPVTI